MPLHVDNRPRSFDEMVGNLPTIESLKSVIEREDRPHSYLFSGPAGCGKTTLARICANVLGATGSDLVEFNTSNTRGIDTARRIISDMGYKPVHGKVRVFILDEVHQTTRDFQDAMLKAIEEPPNHVYFFLCTTDPEKLLGTIKSRCTQFTVAKLPVNRLKGLLSSTCKENKITITDEVLDEICRASDGTPRDALVILDQIRDLPEQYQIKAVREAVIDEKTVIDLCRRLLNPKVKWNLIQPILKGIPTDNPEKVRYAVLGYMSSVLLNEDNPQAALIIECFSQPFHYSGKAGLIKACYDVVVVSK